MESKKDGKNYISVIELAQILGISRIAVFNRIKKGVIPAERFGRGYLISKDYVSTLTKNTNNNAVTEEDRKLEIDRAVKKVVLEYGETLKLLGKE